MQCTLAELAFDFINLYYLFLFYDRNIANSAKPAHTIFCVSLCTNLFHCVRRGRSKKNTGIKIKSIIVFNQT